MRDAADELARRTLSVLKVALLSSAGLEALVTYAVAISATYIGLVLLRYVHVGWAPIDSRAARRALPAATGPGVLPAVPGPGGRLPQPERHRGGGQHPGRPGRAGPARAAPTAGRRPARSAAVTGGGPRAGPRAAGIPVPTSMPCATSTGSCPARRSGRGRGRVGGGQDHLAPAGHRPAGADGRHDRARTRRHRVGQPAALLLPDLPRREPPHRPPGRH